MKRTYALLIAPLLAAALLGCARDDDADATADADRAAVDAVTTAPPPANPTVTEPSVSDSMRENMRDERGMAQTGQSADPLMTDEPSTLATPAPGQQHSTTGTVTAIDAEEGKVTVAHEAVPELEWPAMTMDFAVENADSLDEIEVGDTIEFSFAMDGDRYVIQDIDES